MKTGKTYKQIFVESENDYPSVDDYYFCNRNGVNTYQRLLHDPPDKSYMRGIRWYLLEQPEPDKQLPGNRKSAEKILLESVVKNKTSLRLSKPQKEAIINAMLEYTSECGKNKTD